MSFSVQLGLLLAVATAFTSVVGFLYKYRGAVASQAIEWRRPIHSTLVLFRSPAYSLGIVIALGSWSLHVAALSLAPISLVQSVIAGGLVLLTVVAHRLFAHKVTRREWIGVALAATGLAFLAATIGDTNEAYSGFDPPVLAGWVAACAGAGLALAAVAHRRAHAGVLLGASAGMLWAASDTSIKAWTGQFDEGFVAIFVNPLAVFILIASLVGLLVSARSFQIGEAVPVIAVTSVTANLLTIAAGPAVFDDPMRDDSLGLAARLLAFGLVVCAAALTPAPIRPARVEPA